MSKKLRNLGHVHITYEVLKKLLKLPDDVDIVSVENNQLRRTSTIHIESDERIENYTAPTYEGCHSTRIEGDI